MKRNKTKKSNKQKGNENSDGITSKFYTCLDASFSFFQRMYLKNYFIFNARNNNNQLLSSKLKMKEEKNVQFKFAASVCGNFVYNAFFFFK